MPATAPAAETVAADGLLAKADHVPPEGLNPVKVVVVVGAQTLWSPPALGLALRVICTVSAQPFKLYVKLYTPLRVMFVTAPAALTAADTVLGWVNTAHVPPEGVADKVAVVVGEHIVWSAPALGLALRTTAAVSVHVWPPAVTE